MAGVKQADAVSKQELQQIKDKHKVRLTPSSSRNLEPSSVIWCGWTIIIEYIIASFVSRPLPSFLLLAARKTESLGTRLHNKLKT